MQPAELPSRWRAERKAAESVAEALASWQAWHCFLKPQHEPPQFQEDQILQGVYPWDPSSGAAGITKEMLQLRMHQTSAEHKRCQEELQYLPADAAKVQKYGLYQIRQLIRSLAEKVAERLQIRAKKIAIEAQVHADLDRI